jgi:hypothetical protein
MSAVKKIRKEAGKGRLVITPRKKGEHVPRKLFLDDGTKLEVLTKERPLINVTVSDMVEEFDIKNTYAQASSLYLRAVAKKTGNRFVVFNIIDRNDIRFVRGFGEMDLCLRRMMPSEVLKLPFADKLMETPKVYYEAVPSIDLADFFRKHDWKAFLHLYVTEGLPKDSRLVDWFKTILVPLIPENWRNVAELSNLQFLNNNTFLLLNSQTGKSELSRLCGESAHAVSEYSQPGLYGSMTKGVETKGVLDSFGQVFFDECTFLKTYDIDSYILTQLLTYLSHGTAARSLKEGMICRGTRTAIFSSNPKDDDDLLLSLHDFVEVLAGKSYPQKIGSRIGSLLLSTDFNRISPEKAVSSYRNFTSRLLGQIWRKYYFSRIYPVMKMNFRWAGSNLQEVANTYKQVAASCPDKLVSDFIEGMSMSIHKLKFAAIRYIILEHLDQIVLDFNQKLFQKRYIEPQREEVFGRLVKINLESFGHLAADLGVKTDDDETVKRMKKKFPSVSVRDLERITGVSKSNIARILKAEGGDDATELEN